MADEAKPMKFDKPQRFPIVGDLVHVLYQDPMLVGGPIVLRAVTVTNISDEGFVVGWLWNDAAFPFMMMVQTPQGPQQRPAPALLDIRPPGLPHDRTGTKPNHWHWPNRARAQVIPLRAVPAETAQSGIVADHDVAAVPEVEPTDDGTPAA